MEKSLAVPSGGRLAAFVIDRTVANQATYLDTNDSAFCALTDFRRDDPITAEVDSSLDNALADMNRLGVHALLVTRQEIDGVGEQVVGLITYDDVERRRPYRYSALAVSRQRSDIRVGDVMTPCDELPLVKYESLQSLTAYDLYEMFQGIGLTHLLVVETHDYESGSARGLLSRATLAKRLRRPRAASVR
jgi:CBS domain-containing protein